MQISDYSSQAWNIGLISVQDGFGAIPLSNIDAAWGKSGDGPSGVRILNLAFRYLFTSLNALDAAKDEPGVDYFDMYIQLQMAAEYSSPYYPSLFYKVNTLDKAFQHLLDNRGRWTDESLKDYAGGSGKCLSQTEGGKGPLGCVAFLDRLDYYREQIAKRGSAFQTKFDRIKQAWRDNGWEELGKALKEVAEDAELVKKWSWVVPDRYQSVAKSVTEFAEAAGTIADIASKVHTGATMVTDARYSNDRINFAMNNRYSPDVAGYAALGIIGIALSKLPVLGGFYGRIVEGIPDLAQWFSDVCRERRLAAERAASGR